MAIPEFPTCPVCGDTLTLRFMGKNKEEGKKYRVGCSGIFNKPSCDLIGPKEATKELAISSFYSLLTQTE